MTADESLLFNELPKYHLPAERVKLTSAGPTEAPVFGPHQIQLHRVTYRVRGEALQDLENRIVKELLGHPRLNRAESVTGAVEWLRQLKYYGPYVVICSPDTFDRRGGEYAVIDGVSSVISVRNDLVARRTIVVQTTPDVIDIIVAEECTKVADGVRCCMVPRVRVDDKGNVGAAVVQEKKP